MSVDPLLQEFAEAPERFVEIPKGASVERSDDGRRCVVWGKTWATVAAISVENDDVEPLVQEVRQLIPPTCESLWHVGPSSRPADLVEQLARHELVPPEHRPFEVRAMVLTTEPEAVADVEVQRLETFGEFLAAREVAWDAFGAPEERRAIERAHLDEEFDDRRRTGLPVEFIVRVDDRIAGSAVAVPSRRGVLLGGGSVASWARGKGLYRALVHARWDYAVAKGAPALVTHANPKTSYPILVGLGFEEIGTIRRLQDRARSPVEPTTGEPTS